MAVARLLGLMLGAVALCTLGCGGTSAPPRQLRSSSESSAFVASVARRGNAEGWVLAAHAAPAVASVWAQRAAIADLGARIRKEGGSWGCELAAGSYRLGSVGVFGAGDHQSLSNEARESGAKESQIRAFFADIGKMSMIYVREATAALCPEPLFR